MSEITDDYMMAQLGKSREYTVVLLQPGPAYEPISTRSAEVKKLVWEHGRRNFELRASHKLVLVGPGSEAGLFAGMGVFNATIDETKALMAGDPAVAAGVFVCQFQTWRSFPGDSLPA